LPPRRRLALAELESELVIVAVLARRAHDEVPEAREPGERPLASPRRDAEARRLGEGATQEHRARPRPQPDPVGEPERDRGGPGARGPAPDAGGAPPPTPARDGRRLPRLRPQPGRALERRPRDDRARAPRAQIFRGGGARHDADALDRRLAPHEL